MIFRMPALRYDSLVDELREFAPYRRARSDVQQKELLQRERPLLFFGISDLDEDVEVDEGFEERQLRPFILPDFS